MHHTLAYRSSIADVTLANVTPVNDGIVVIQNNHFMFQEDKMLYAAVAGGIDLQRARIVTPTFRQITSPFIRPVQALATGGSLPGVSDYRRNPLRLKAREEIAFEAFQDSGGAQVAFGLLMAMDRFLAAPAGDTYRLRGESATAATAGAWSLLAMTWADQLPDGRYACVGLGHVSATAISARLTFENQYWRPGCLSAIDAQDIPDPIFGAGGLGVWGYFEQTRMPSVEALCVAADAAHQVYMDIIRVE